MPEFRKPGLVPAVVILEAVTAGAFVLFQFAFIGRDLDYLVSHFPIDDTFYYLQTAWTFASTGVVSFDGIHATNGVQLLWFLVVSLIGVVSTDREIFVRLVLAACFLLNAACLWPIRSIARLSGRAELSMFMGAFWLLVVITNHVYLSGMENSLHALVFWCATWSFMSTMKRIDEGGRPGLLGLTALLVLNVWTRLDAAVFSVLIFVVCIGSLYRASGGARRTLDEHGRQIATAGSLAAIGALLQFGAFRIMGGSFLPVSSLVKSADASFSLEPARWAQLADFVSWGPPSVEAYLSPAMLAMAVALVLLVAMLIRVPPRGIAAGAAIAALVAVFVLGAMASRYVAIVVPAGVAAAIYLRSRTDRPLVPVWWTLLAASVIYTGTFAFGGIHYIDYFWWYRTPLYVFWVLTGAVTILALERIASRWMSQESLLLAGAGVAVLILASAAGGYSLGFVHHDMLQAKYRAGLKLAEIMPEDGVAAAWNAGAVGYFSDRKVINLDGLVNDPAYFKEVLQGNRPLVDYLRENKVRYVVDYCCVDEKGLRSSLSPVASIPSREGWTPVFVWAFQPVEKADR